MILKSLYFLGDIKFLKMNNQHVFSLLEEALVLLGAGMSFVIVFLSCMIFVLFALKKFASFFQEEQNIATSFSNETNANLANKKIAAIAIAINQYRNSQKH